MVEMTTDDRDIGPALRWGLLGGLSAYGVMFGIVMLVG